MSKEERISRGASHRREIWHGKGSDLVQGHVKFEASLALSIIVEAEGESVVLGLRLGQLGLLNGPHCGRGGSPVLRVLVKDPAWMQAHRMKMGVGNKSVQQKRKKKK